MHITVNENIVLELTSIQHAAGLFAAVDNSREHLSRFLPWVTNMRTEDNMRQYLQHCEQLYREATEVSFVIKYDGTIAGRIGLHYIHSHNKIAAIGYWISKTHEGKGIVLRSCKAVIEYGFEQLGLHRIEIKAAVKNTRSQAVPEKLHFTREAILREAEWVNDEFIDLYLYSLLQQEWKNLP